MFEYVKIPRDDLQVVLQAAECEVHNLRNEAGQVGLIRKEKNLLRQAKDIETVVNKTKPILKKEQKHIITEKNRLLQQIENSAK